MDVRHFGVAEANRHVPLLRRTFTVIREELRRIQELDGQLRRPGTPVPLVEERAVRIRRVQDALQELADLGIEVKAVDGLVDFRALRDGRTVYLCWHFGEEQVGHWHELDAGFAGRRPIQDPGDFAPTYDA